jgi:hypothetical protein
MSPASKQPTKKEISRVTHPAFYTEDGGRTFLQNFYQTTQGHILEDSTIQSLQWKPQISITSQIFSSLKTEFTRPQLSVLNLRYM